MKKNQAFRYVARYIGGLLLFAGGALSSTKGSLAVSCLLFLVLAVLECALVYSETRKLFDLRILMSFSWCAGIALTALKLTNLSSPFGVKTWFVLGGFYFAFLFAYDLLELLLRKKEANSDVSQENRMDVPGTASAKRAFFLVIAVAVLSVGAFLVEAVKFRFQFPILVSGKPHAYTDFHITGVHYFVVSCVFVPALTVYYLFLERPKLWQALILFFANAAALSVPVLLLSKLYLVLFFVFPFIVFLLLQKKLKRWKLLLIVAGIVLVSAAVFVFLVSRRQYPAGYLQSVFQFKDESVPVAVQYPYVYVTNNYENLNLLVESGDLPTYGLRQLFPVFALTGLKFRPEIASLLQFPVHNTVEELTTVSIVYDAFGDFGSAGVIVFGMLLGVLAYFLTKRIAREKKIFTVLLYMQVAVYFGLSFFATWFSNPTTWFWFALTLVFGLVLRKKGEHLW